MRTDNWCDKHEWQHLPHFSCFITNGYSYKDTLLNQNAGTFEKEHGEPFPEYNMTSSVAKERISA